MRILVASCVFPPEPVVSAKTSFDVASHFSADSEVVVASPKPSRNFVGTCEGFGYPFKLVRMWALSSSKSTFLSRFFENISLGASLFWFVLTAKKFDVIYSNVWPIFATGLLLIAAKLRGSKVIVSVQDVYPESLTHQSRVSESSIFYRILFKLDALIARSVDHVIVISDNFKDKYIDVRGVKKEKISVIENWVDGDKVVPVKKADARKELSEVFDVPEFGHEDIVLVYGGNIGSAAGLDYVHGLINYLPEKFKFLVAGGGSFLPELRTMLAEQVGRRVFFVSPWPEEYTSITFGSADILFLPTAKGQSLASVPSKLITYMLSGRPVFAIVDERSDTARAIVKSRGGCFSGEGTSADIASELVSFAEENSSRLPGMGRAAREYALKTFSFDMAKEKLDEIIKSSHRC